MRGGKDSASCPRRHHGQDNPQLLSGVFHGLARHGHVELHYIRPCGLAAIGSVYVDLELARNFIDFHALRGRNPLIVCNNCYALGPIRELAARALRRQSEHNGGAGDGFLVLVFDPDAGIAQRALADIVDRAFATHDDDVQLRWGRLRPCPHRSRCKKQKGNRELPHPVPRTRAYLNVFVIDTVLVSTSFEQFADRVSRRFVRLFSKDRVEKT